MYVIGLCTSFLGLITLPQPTPTTATTKSVSKPIAKAASKEVAQSNLCPHRKPSIEIVEDEDKDNDRQQKKFLSSDALHILERADGSDNPDDGDDDDMPGLVTDSDCTDDEGDEDEQMEECKESAEEELKCLSKDWNSPIYVFFKQTPSIEYINNRCVHVFECIAKGCKGRGNGHYVRHYLDTTDAKSMSNLCKHAKNCWSEVVVAAVDGTKNVNVAQEAIQNLKNVDSSITVVFKRVSKEKVTYSHRQDTKTEAWAEIIRWVAESKRPFQVIVKMLQENDGTLSFATNAWMSPNHKAYVAITVHFEHEGIPISTLLDLVDVAKSHSGVNLVTAFAQVLEEFGISDKVLSKL
ncbi:hypothetical protein K443DRAFT_15827 [Laccaria amethystina LaAM-08-1]|uniref:Uncharacterized protein n=1 Tax=Laccaria amethystina LaAM-08-1 TaxID=1095629 RepID=A0A0C9WWN1_9AGAR|nr:hypothetical protein K443DRAFT_15827 [Laccaria amethystina LaAM-08-1]